MTDQIDYWQPFTKAEQTSQWGSGLGEQLKQATNGQPMFWQFDQGKLQTCLTPISFWVIYTFPEGGKLAIRTCFDPQTIQSVRLHKKTKTKAEYHVDGLLGRFQVTLERCVEKPMVLRYTTSLTPKQDFTV